jgi:anti-sigma factor RsiW
MNGSAPDERLSAWLDNELSLKERADVEKLLAASPDLRDGLDDFEKLSTLLRSVPQSVAPPELHSAVMRAIERESLLAAATMAEHDGSVSASRTRRFGRVLATSVALAVAISAGVWFFGSDGHEVAETDSVPASQRIVSANGPVAVSAANKREIPAGDGSAVPVESRQRVLQIRRNDLDAARVGDIVEAVETDGDSVSVIRLTVINRRNGMHDLQVLLSRQNIRTGDDESPEANDGELVAVYVQSDPELLRKAMAELRDRVEFDSLDVTPSVQLAELEPDFVSSLGIDSSSPPANGEATQKRVNVSPGSRLGQIVRDSGTVGSDAARSLAPEPTVSQAEKSSQPVRVIFVFVDPKQADDVPRPPSENGAA